MTARKLTIFGASGGTGRLLVTQALAAGQDVEAVVRNPGSLTVSHPRFSMTVADVLDPRAIEASVADSDAVLSALGPRKGEPATITADGVASILQAMKATGVRRIVAISAAPLEAVSSVDPLYYRLFGRALLWRFFGDAYRALRIMERTLAESGADWTVVRPAALSDGPLTGGRRLVLDHSEFGAVRISRADVAGGMLRVLDQPESVGRYVRFV